jgi:nicotinamidase-related amidase
MTISQNILSRAGTGIVVVDIQAKLTKVMRRPAFMVDNVVRLLRFAVMVNLPVVATEQYPRMMGRTLPEVREAVPHFDPLPKMEFDCCAAQGFTDRLAASSVNRIILTGVETHICIFQTCLSLLEAGYAVHVPQDAVDSRTEENWQVGLELMKSAGAVITSSETIIFQILKKAGTSEFKQAMKLIVD